MTYFLPSKSPTVLPSPTMLDAAPAAGASRGNSPAPRAGLPLPSQAASPASSFQPFPGDGRGGWVLHTTNEDGNSGEHDDATADHEGGSEDGEEDDTSPSEDHGYGVVEKDSAAPLEDEYDGGDQDDCGAASEDSDDDIVPLGRRAVQLLAIRANFHICAINCYDWRLAQCIYSQHEMEVQEEEMVDLVPVGPRCVLEAYGSFALEVFHSITVAGNTTTTGNEGSRRIRYSAPIKVEWDVCGQEDDDDDLEPEKYIQTICGKGPGRKMEITFLVIPNAIETKVEVELKLKNLGSRSHAVYGKIKASTADYGNKSVHLFSRERGRSWSVPFGPTSILPLSPAKIALPYRQQLELDIEVDLIVIRVFDNKEEYKNLKFSLTFTRGIRSQQREVDDDQIEVSIAFYPKI